MSNKIVKENILIGVPCLNDAPIEFTKCVNDIKLNAKHQLTYTKSAEVSMARDSIVKDAIAMNASHIMFIDSDILFPSDGIEKLLKHNADIVAGLYYTKDFNNCLPVAWDNLGFREDNGRATAERITDIKPYRKVDAIGMGFALIKTEVIIAVINKFNAAFMHDFGSSEDISFCIRAGLLGYDVMMDSTINLVHMGSYGYSKRDYLRCKGE